MKPTNKVLLNQANTSALMKHAVRFCWVCGLRLKESAPCSTQPAQVSFEMAGVGKVLRALLAQLLDRQFQQISPSYRVVDL